MTTVGAPAPQLGAGGGERALQAVLEATQALLWARSEERVRAIALDLVVALGGTPVPADEADAAVIPVDLSFGVGEPLVVQAADPAARRVLQRHVPEFVRCGQRALELHDVARRLAADASLDPLTGLGNRRMSGRVLGRLGPADSVVLLDLDHFKRVNDQLGHDVGDEVLRAFGGAIASTMRGRDHAGRWGGEEFVLVLHESEPERFLERLAEKWAAVRPLPVTFSAGVAASGANPGTTMRAADAALYRAKQGGRDRWERATPEDYAGGDHDEPGG